jgi:hypothetical protein
MAQRDTWMSQRRPMQLTMCHTVLASSAETRGAERATRGWVSCLGRAGMRRRHTADECHQTARCTRMSPRSFACHLQIIVHCSSAAEAREHTRAGDDAPARSGTRSHTACRSVEGRWGIVQSVAVMAVMGHEVRRYGHGALRGEGKLGP